MKLAQRRLDAAGCINQHCNRANDPQRVQRLLAAQQMAKSMADVARAQQQEKREKAAAADAELLSCADAAIAKLKAKGLEASKLTMPEIRAVSWSAYRIKLKAAGVRKEELAAQLQGYIRADEGALDGHSNGRAALAPTAAEDEVDDDFDD